MQRLVLLLVVSVLLVTGLAGDSTAGEFDLAGWTAVEGRYFPLEPLFPSQPSTNLSYVLRPEFYFGWKRGNQSINVIPFMRIDQHDSYRSHFDIREALYLYVGGRWELRAGIGTVFWGGHGIPASRGHHQSDRPG